MIKPGLGPKHGAGNHGYTLLINGTEEALYRLLKGVLVPISVAA